MSRVRYPFGHFPFLVPHVASSAVGARTLYPVGFSLADAMHLFWTEQRYSAIGTCFADSTAISGSGYTETLTAGATLQIHEYSDALEPTVASDESVMAALSDHDVAGAGVSGPGIHDGQLSINAGIWHFPSGTLYPPPARIVFCVETGLYYPLMGVRLEYSLPGYETFVGSMLFQTYDGYYGPDYGLFSSSESYFSLFGQTFPAVCVRTRSDLTGSALGGMSVDSWWPYANRSGSVPIYNANDGTRANNPATSLPFTDSEIIAAAFP